jgi:hypothetical protein
MMEDRMGSSLCLIASIAISYCPLKCLYPLSRFPGPEITTFRAIYMKFTTMGSKMAVTSGRPQIEKMHRKYGMRLNSKDGILLGCLKASDI